jgi:hypothetical protein
MRSKNAQPKAQNVQQKFQSAIVLYSSRREAQGNLPGQLSFASLSEWA